MYDLIRRRIAPVALMAALGFFAWRTCSSQNAQVVLRFDVGSAQADVRALRVDVFRPGASSSVAFLERRFEAGGPADIPQLSMAMVPGPYQVVIRVSLDSNGHTTERVIERTIEAIDQATITLALERDLLGRGT